MIYFLKSPAHMSFWVTEYWNIKKTKWWNYTSMYKSRKSSSSIFEMEQKDKNCESFS